MTEHESWDSTLQAAGIVQPERERIIRTIEERRSGIEQRSGDNRTKFKLGMKPRVAGDRREETEDRRK